MIFHNRWKIKIRFLNEYLKNKGKSRLFPLKMWKSVLKMWIKLHLISHKFDVEKFKFCGISLFGK